MLHAGDDRLRPTTTTTPGEDPPRGADHGRVDRQIERMADDTPDELRTILLAFVEAQGRSRAEVAGAEVLASGLAASEPGAEEIAYALSLYDPSGTTPGTLDNDGLAAALRDALHDLGDHTHCVHDLAAADLPIR
jgi:hypothetical protein